MDVASRLSHGFSYEGYSITKFFLLELVFLFVGYLTFVSEIQEFCTFAFIGLVVDFYMQVGLFVIHIQLIDECLVVLLRALFDPGLASIGQKGQVALLSHALQHGYSKVAQLSKSNVKL